MATTIISKIHTHLLTLTILFLTLTLTPNHPLLSSAAAPAHAAIYIVHLDREAMPSPFQSPNHWHSSLLSSLSSGPTPVHLYTYDHVASAFSAALMWAHVEELESLPGFIAAFEDKPSPVRLYTTHTPKFLGLNRHMGMWPRTGFGEGMIIGIVDTGIWPEIESLRDDGMPLVPKKWRGLCENGDRFNSSLCNKKIIGARSFSRGLKQAGFNISKNEEYDSPRDFNSHGSQVSTVAAGTPSRCASYFGYAKGTAVGIAPKAHLAMYKAVFDQNPVFASDELAAMDQAIADGVDLISLSISSAIEAPFFDNPIALGAFAAMEKGIFVACAASNEGKIGSVVNGVPWVTTVGAGSVDREFAGQITLGEDEIIITGRSGYAENIRIFQVPLYFGHGNITKETCSSFEPGEVSGKYVFCDITNYSLTSDFYIPRGAQGAIFSINSGMNVDFDDFRSPFVIVHAKDGEIIKNYAINNKNPSVSIKFQVTVLGVAIPAPRVAEFSSRGPYPVTPWVLKPDVLAPGKEILVPCLPYKICGFIAEGDTGLAGDYTIESGTSFAAPYIVGIAALLKKEHPEWSPATIRSALMTTADVYDNEKSSIMDMGTGLAASPLDFGAGHVNPTKAADPGLVYELGPQDYVDFLCGMNYTHDQLRIVTRNSMPVCRKKNLDLNYPSFVLILNGTNGRYAFERELTSLGEKPSVYNAQVSALEGMRVEVEPPTLSFPRKCSKAAFKVTVQLDLKTSSVGDYEGTFGFLSWVEKNRTHVVRSPIVAAFAPPMEQEGAV